MGKESRIAWTKSTFNPWWGCTKVSPGCAHCYAESESKRFGKDCWGQGAKRRLMSPHYWNQPLKWEEEAAATKAYWPVFAGSMCDVMDPEGPATELRALFALIKRTPHLTWLLCTKRPENFSRDGYLPTDWSADNYPNVCLIATVENNRFLIPRLEALKRVEARWKALSCEPLLEDLDFSGLEVGWNLTLNPILQQINWLIVGGESGPSARWFSPIWAEHVIQFGRRWGIRVFVKQMGSRVVGIKLAGKGDDPRQWPEFLRVQEPLPVGLDQMEPRAFATRQWRGYAS